MKYQLSEEMTGEEAAFVRRKLIEYADDFTGPRDHQAFGVALRNSGGDVVGGITAGIVWDWLMIEYLWVDDGLRGRGFGHALLERAETVGRERGCRFARLSTFEFEARSFYEQHGYVVRAALEDFPRGHTQFLMTRAL